MNKSPTSFQAQPTRRQFIQIVGGAIIAGATGLGYTRFVEPNWIDVEHINLAIPNLPEHLIGRKIAQLSDIHLSPYVNPEDLLKAVNIINKLAPDWLMLTGDYVSPTADYAVGLVEPLRQLTMPTFAVFGNHDHWSNLAIVQRNLEETPVQILQNQAVVLEKNLWLAGVDDMWSGRPDLVATMTNVPKDALTLLMAHEPDFFDNVIAADAPIAAQFSGHSHGGQVRLPTLNVTPTGHRSWAPILPKYGKRYPIGLRTIGQRTLYTNRGMGLWPIPYRFNCRPEISVFTLVPTA